MGQFYKVLCVETQRKTICVEADDEQEAKKIAAQGMEAIDFWRNVDDIETDTIIKGKLTEQERAQLCPWEIDAPEEG